MGVKISDLTAKGSKIASTDIVEVSVNTGLSFVSRKVTGSELNELSLDTTPQLGGNLDVNSNKITSASNGNIVIEPNGSGAILIGGNSTQPAEMRFMEDSDNGANYVALKASTTLAANTTYTLPTADGTSGQFLSTNGSGVLSFATVSGGGITIGTTAVTSGTIGRVFFQGTGDVVQQSASLFWDNTNSRLGVGETPASTVRLDVRAQGALSTDIAFRVRNSADTANIFTVSGDNTIKLLSNPASVNGIAISAGAFSAPLMTFSDVFAEVIRISAITNTVRSPNFRSGSETGNGYFGIVNPTSQNRFLKFVNVFGLETLSIGGNNYDGDATFTLKSFSGAADTNIFTITRTDNTKPFVISNQANIGIGGTTFGTSSKFVTAQFTGTAPTTSPADAFQQYSADITAGNAAPHFRTENGAIVKIYQETTAVAAATVVSGAGGNVKHDDTFDGYTVEKVVRALRNLGILA